MMTKTRCCVFITLTALLAGCGSNDWRSASRASSGIAPLPSEHSDAVIQVYAADLFGVRGYFAVHTWIATKAQNADQYTVYDVVGWRTNRGLPALQIGADIPDRYWYGAKPNPVLDLRGEDASTLIPKIDEAAQRYPYANEYTLFPGPNSNTFPAWIGQQVPELGLTLPFKAFGSGFVE